MGHKHLRRSNRGFSLIELLVATAVFLIVIAVGAQLIQLANFDSRTNANLNDVQQNARVAMKFLERDITNSGQEFLVGSPPPGGGVVGPIVPKNLFLAVRGGTTTNVPTTGNNSQELFCLLPVSKKDNLGNGNNAANGSSDRLTVGYKDEFFIGGSSDAYTNAAATGAPIAGTHQDITDDIRGDWNRTAKTLTFSNEIVPNPDGTFTKRAYSVSNLKAGDVMLLTNDNGVTLLAMITAVDTANNKITFGTEPLSFNQISSGTPTSLTTALYPLDRLPEDPPYVTSPAPLVRAKRVKLYTYFVDTASRNLIRRSYQVGNATATPPIPSMDDAVVCENVERFSLTYKTLGTNTAVVPPAPIIMTDTINPDTTATDYDKLQKIRLINVELIVRSREIDRRNSNPARYAIQASFAPRNIAYVANQNQR